MSRAIIFDFDGVLVDSERYWPDVTRQIFELHAKLPWTDADCRSMTGLGLHECHRRFSENFGMTLTRDEFETYLLEEVASMYDTHIDLMPGTLELLHRARDAGIPMGIASSNKGEVIARSARRLGIEHFMDAIASADDVNQRSKPLPDVYLLAAKRLDIDPERCIAIEDSAAGVAAALAAGMRCVALRSEHNDHQNLDAAHAHIRHFDECTLEYVDSLFR